LALRRSFERIVVWRRDRWGRDAIGCGFFERILQDAGVRIESTQQGPQEDTAHNRFVTRIMDAVGELEAETTKERCRLGRLAAVRAGYWPSKAPYGYCKGADEKLCIDAEAAVVIQNAFEAYAAGAPGHAVARIFGVTVQAALKRLHNPLYCGRGTYAEVPITVPAIVSEALWQRVQDQILRMQHTPFVRVLPYAAREATRSRGAK
jgi:DNA invertase Pin-like site-specific DNA recombinase